MTRANEIERLKSLLPNRNKSDVRDIKTGIRRFLVFLFKDY